MIFGPRPVAQAAGCILAHSVRAPGVTLRKGHVLTEQDTQDLAQAGLTEVTVAALDRHDMGEDRAAETIAHAMKASHMSVSAPFTGRANLFAGQPGVLSVDAGNIAALNGIDEAITLATLPDMTRVQARQMLATVKIIPYGASAAQVQAAAKLAAGSVRLHPFQDMRVDLIQTRLPGMADKLLDKGVRVTQTRLAGLGLTLSDTHICAHAIDAVAASIGASTADLILILGASATSDRQDVCPAGLLAAGGQVTRFGMPVDPGNLLFLGSFGDRHVVGLPGCARSPALNGADWVLERLVAGLAVRDTDIAGMGVGGLLKEIATRPQPRSGNARAPRKPRIEAIILAAGQSSRMRGADKLLETVDGQAQLARIADAALAADVDHVQVVLPPDADARRAALANRDVAMTVALDAAEGMGASIRAGMAARHPDSDAVLLVLADMPDVTPRALNLLIAGFDPGEGRTIVQATDSTGQPGHPVLFGKRFFEDLSALQGDTGARAVLRAGAAFTVQVATDGLSATTDLDTPEDWAAWRVKTGKTA